MLSLEHHCPCGASLKISTSDTYELDKIASQLEAFKEIHQGHGSQATPPTTASPTMGSRLVVEQERIDPTTLPLLPLGQLAMLSGRVAQISKCVHAWATIAVWNLGKDRIEACEKCPAYRYGEWILAPVVGLTESISAKPDSQPSAPAAEAAPFGYASIPEHKHHWVAPSADSLGWHEAPNPTGSWCQDCGCITYKGQNLHWGESLPLQLYGELPK